MYRFRWITPVLVAAVMGATGSGLEAQSYRTAIGLYGGGTWTSGLATAAALDPRLDAGWTGGLELEQWLGSGRAGLRLGGSFSETPITPTATDLNLYSGDVSLLVRLLSPRPMRVVAPFFSLGGGAMHYNFVDVTPFLDGEVLLEQDPVTQPAVMAGFGLDLAPAPGVGLRLEGVDRVAIQSPFVDDAGEAYDFVHHVRYTASIQVRFGRLGPGTPTFAAAEPVDAPPEPEAADVRTTSAEATSPPAANAEGRERSGTERALEARVAELERAVARNAEQVGDLRTTVSTLDRGVQADAPGTAPERGTLEGRYYTVQVAAYEDPAGARRLAQRMSGHNLPTWVSRVERSGRVYHRVRVGVVPTEAEAQRLGRRLRAETGSPVWIVPVGPSASVTQDAVVATRAFMSDS